MELEDSTPRTTLKSSSRKRDRSLPARPAGDPLAPTERRRRPIWPRVNSVDSRPQFPKDPGHGGCAATVARPPPTAKEWRPQWVAWPKKRIPWTPLEPKWHTSVGPNTCMFQIPRSPFPTRPFTLVDKKHEGRAAHINLFSLNARYCRCRRTRYQNLRTHRYGQQCYEHNTGIQSWYQTHRLAW